jgi:hypothetical protein
MQKIVAKENKIGKVGGIIGAFAPPLKSWTEFRDAPVIAQKSFREIWRERSATNKHKKDTK